MDSNSNLYAPLHSHASRDGGIPAQAATLSEMDLLVRNRTGSLSNSPYYDSPMQAGQFESAPAVLERPDKMFEIRLPLSSNLGAGLNIVKAIVGAGSFSLPLAFLNMGLWGGVLCIAVFSALCLYTIGLLVECKRHVARQMLARGLNYVDVARYAFGPVGAWIVYTLSLSASFGVCAAYLVFIGQLSYALIPHIGSFHMSEVLWMAIAVLVVIPITQMRSFSYLSYTSVIGNLFLLGGMAATVYYGFAYESLASPFDTDVYPPFKLETFPDSFGSVAFLFAIHFLVLPIEKSMKTPSGFHMSLTVSVFIVAIFNAAFGFLGYMFFKGATQEIVILNLGDTPFMTTVKACLCVDLLFTYAITFAPSREILEKSLLTPDTHWLEVKRTVIRLFLVGVTFGVAQIKSFDTIVNLVGGFAQSSLGLVIPPLMYLRFFHHKMSWLKIALFCLLIVVGLAAVGISTTVTIVNFFKKK